MKEIVLNIRNSGSPNYKKYKALVDDEDFDLVNKYNWSIRLDRGTNYCCTPIKRNGKKTTLLMHTLITGLPCVDHINGDGLDNRRSNLRKVNHSQNAMNSRSRKNSMSKFKGVTWHEPLGKWRAKIGLNGRGFHLGYFSSEIEAAKAYNEKANKLFGEFARLNEI